MRGFFGDSLKQSDYGAVALTVMKPAEAFAIEKMRALSLEELLIRCQQYQPDPRELLKGLPLDDLWQVLGDKLRVLPDDLSTKKTRYVISALFQKEKLIADLQGLLHAGVKDLHLERAVVGRVTPLVGFLFTAALVGALTAQYWTLVPTLLFALGSASRWRYEKNCQWQAAENFKTIEAAKADLDADKLALAIDKLYPLMQRFPVSDALHCVYPGARVLAVKRIFKGLVGQAYELQTYLLNLIEVLALERSTQRSFNAVVFGR